MPEGSEADEIPSPEDASRQAPSGVKDILFSGELIRLEEGKPKKLGNGALLLLDKGKIFIRATPINIVFGGEDVGYQEVPLLAPATEGLIGKVEIGKMIPEENKDEDEDEAELEAFDRLMEERIGKKELEKIKIESERSLRELSKAIDNIQVSKKCQP